VQEEKCAVKLPVHMKESAVPKRRYQGEPYGECTFRLSTVLQESACTASPDRSQISEAIILSCLGRGEQECDIETKRIYPPIPDIMEIADDDTI